MTIEPMEDIELESALAMLWDRHRPNIMDRISLLELKTADVLRDVIDEEGIVEGSDAAHKLAGSLGMYGYQQGTEIASKMERILKSPTPETLVTLRALAVDLRKSLATGLSPKT